MEMEEIEQRIASDQLIEGVPWDWVVINGRMARCINPFVDLPDAADGWKSVQRPIRLPWGRLTHPSELLKIGQEIDVCRPRHQQRERARIAWTQTNTAQP